MIILYLHISIIILGICGFILANYIHNKKKFKKPLICPLRFKCTKVIESNYSRIFNIPIEIFGMIYYFLITVGYVFLVLNLVNTVLYGLLFVMSTGALLFSLYLIMVQWLLIREWCTWCLSSAIVSTLIFILSYLSYIN